MTQWSNYYTPQSSRLKRRAVACFLALVLAALQAPWTINSAGTDGSEEGDKSMRMRIEAEQGEIKGAQVLSVKEGYSGDGYVGAFENEGDEVTVLVEVEEAGPYRLGLGYYLPTESGHKINTILVNGSFYTKQQFEAGESFQHQEVGLIALQAGENTLTFRKEADDWGWMYVDYFSLLPTGGDSGFRYETEAALIDPEATPETVRLYQYLRSLYGEKVLSGQQLYFTAEEEISTIEELTGEKPAMKGYDLINQTPGGHIDDQVERAIRWVEEEQGILTLCWHWWAPKDGRAFYTAETEFDVKAAVTPGQEEYDLIIRDIDIISGLLLDLQERGIPVIWRPLHEASGGWFWWGSEGPEVYQALWDILYERMVHVNGVHNLIWVANGQHPDWYVGDEKADIIGEDIYPGEHVHVSHVAKFEEAYDTVGGQKIVALTENGALPDIDEMKQTGAMWAWFMPWWGEWTVGEKHTSYEVLKSVYAHEDVLVLRDLPRDLYRELPDERPAAELVAAMQPGWNLGNTFDAPSGETSWGNPEVTRELIQAIRAEGFNSIRIPVTWNAFVGEGPEFVIDPAYLARVQEVVDWSLEEGFIVMLNLHHDSNWLFDLPENELLMQRFTRIWEQVAEHYRDYPDELIFEAINEPRFSDDWEASDEIYLAATEQLNEAAYRVIRASGGRNDRRKIVFETLTGGINPTKVARLQAQIKELEDPNLMASVHYYGMWQFSVNVAGRTSFDQEVQGDIDKQLGLVHEELVMQGIPVILGEYGLLGFDQSTEVIQHGEILKFFDYLVAKSVELEITTILWDNGQHYEREALYWRDPALHAVIMAAIEGRSSQTDHDTLYLVEGALTEARMGLRLNGNVLESVWHEDTELQEGSDYRVEGEQLVLSAELLERLTEGRMGRGTVLSLRFDAGPDWELTLAVVGGTVFRNHEVNTYEFLIPAQYAADRVARVKAVDASGQAVGAQSWTPYLSYMDEYEADYGHNYLRLRAPFLTEFGDGDIYLTIEMWSGAEYPYVVTLDGRTRVGVQGTVPARELEAEQVTEPREEVTEPTMEEEPSEAETQAELTELPETSESAEAEETPTRRFGVGAVLAALGVVAAGLGVAWLRKRKRD